MAHLKYVKISNREAIYKYLGNIDGFDDVTGSKFCHLNYKMKANSMSNFMTVLGFLNGMIGGTVLLLPLLGMKSGYLGSSLVCLLVGLAQFYSCYLLVLHIGSSNSLKASVLAHFGNDYRYVKLYSFVFWFYFIPLFFIYFRLIVLQFVGLLGQSSLIAPLSAVALFVMIIGVRVLQIGEETLAYGISSIITYVAFLIWSQVTAPSGEAAVPAFGEVIPLASSLMLAYSVATVVSQNIFKNENREDFLKLVGYTFLWGILIYTFITLGSFSVVNRIPFKKNPQTIEDYFEAGGWQVAMIEILYVVHLFSAFPNFTIISKVRFYELIQVELKKQVAWHEMLYIFLVVASALGVYLADVHLDTMVEINGAVFGYCNSILLPIIMHLKCIYYDKSSGSIGNDHEHNAQIVKNGCHCEHHYSSKWTLYLETFLLVLTCLLGLGLMVQSVLSKVVS